MSCPRLLVAGTHSGVGKTTLTLGILAALRRRNIVVQGYKVGPDYIDPSYHTALTGRPARNLDSWMLGVDTVNEVFLRANRDADLSIIEGVMGLYDGKDPLSIQGSTAEVSCVLQCPVLLVVDASGMARSAAAIVKGFQTLHNGVNIAGVIVNRVGSVGHYRLLQMAIESACDTPVLGYMLGDDELHIPERHLGLIPAIERGELEPFFARLGDLVQETVNLDALLQLAQKAPELECPSGVRIGTVKQPAEVTIAVARDAAFNFYYQENLELLEQFGARLVYFSPLNGDPIPDMADGVYLGGGFPEEFVRTLSEQSSVREQIRQRIVSGLPTYAECGGYMYLAMTLTDLDGIPYAMSGVIPAHVKMQRRLAGFGYREVTPVGELWLLAHDEQARGHEFHYSTIEFEGTYPSAYRQTSSGVTEGYVCDNVIAGYTHLHFASNPHLARNFVTACRSYRQRQRQQTGGSGHG